MFRLERLNYYLLCGGLFLMPIGTSPFTVLMITMLFVWIVSGELVRKRNRYLQTPWFRPLLATVVLIWLGLLYTPDPQGMGLSYAQKTYSWLYALVVASIFLSRENIAYPVNAFLAGLFVNAVVGLLQCGGLIPERSKFGAHGYTGFYGGYNTLAIMLVLGVLTASFCFRAGKKQWHKWVFLLGALTYFAHVIVLGNRGGYLVFAILAPMAIYNFLRSRSGLLVILVYLLVLGVMFSSPVIQDRTIQTIGDFRDHITASEEVKAGEKYSRYVDRIYMWHWAAKLFLQHPLLGVGTGGYQQATLDAGGDVGVAHPHSNVLHVAVSYGLLGLGVFGWFFWVLLKYGWRGRQDLAGFFALSATLVILIGGATDTHILDAGGRALLAIATGFLGGLSANRVSGPQRDKTATQG